MKIFQGDTSTWIEADAPEEASGVVVWLRGKAAGAGLSVLAVKSGGQWSVTLQSSVTAGMTAGIWEVQVVATVGSTQQTVRRGRIEIKQGLQFEGTSSPFDDRSQAERDLEQVEEAIRLLASVDGPQSYEISGGGTTRRVTRVDFPELIRWRDRLAAIVATEKRRTSGAGSGRILVSFE